MLISVIHEAAARSNGPVAKHIAIWGAAAREMKPSGCHAALGLPRRSALHARRMDSAARGLALRSAWLRESWGAAQRRAGSEYTESGRLPMAASLGKLAAPDQLCPLRPACVEGYIKGTERGGNGHGRSSESAGGVRAQGVRRPRTLSKGRHARRSRRSGPDGRIAEWAWPREAGAGRGRSSPGRRTGVGKSA